MHKDMLPGAMASFIGKVGHNYATRGAKSNFFVSHSNCRSVKSIAPKYWNSLSSTLKDSASIATFKEKSKQDLLMPRGVFDGASGAAAAALFVGAQAPLGHKNVIHSKISLSLFML